METKNKLSYLEKKILNAEKKVIYEVLKIHLGKPPKPKHFTAIEKTTDKLSEMQGGYWLNYKGEILGIIKRTTENGNIRILFTSMEKLKAE